MARRGGSESFRPEDSLCLLSGRTVVDVELVAPEGVEAAARRGVPPSDLQAADGRRRGGVSVGRRRARDGGEKLFWGGKTLPGEKRETLPGEKRFGETVERETAVRTCIWCICEIW